VTLYIYIDANLQLLLLTKNLHLGTICFLEKSSDLEKQKIG